MIGWKSREITTATHCGDTDVPVYSHQEWLQGQGRNLGTFLGVKMKPFVRVKMGRGVYRPPTPGAAEEPQGDR